MAVFSVLCIEDNEANMLVLERILASQAWTVYKAGSAEDGLVMAHEHRPNLILMDIGLPGMDGLSATRQIKDQQALKHIPVIAVTASAAYGAEDCMRAGCDGFVTKPITLQRLMSTLLTYAR